MEFPHALKDCDKAIELDPTFIKAHVQKGSILVSQIFKNTRNLN